MINVGTYQTRKVTKLNNELFLKAKYILEYNVSSDYKGDRQGYGSAIGWPGVSEFIDWLEQNYTLKRIKNES